VCHNYTQQLLQLLPTKEIAEAMEFVMPLLIGFLVVGLVMSLGGPTGTLHKRLQKPLHNR
jgi:glycerol uptake facilitator-like aquaporin